MDYETYQDGKTQRAFCDCEYVNETDKAYLLSFINDGVMKDHWFPKSQAFLCKDGRYDIPVWLLEKKGLA